jgi:RNA 3'-terminal phosphate cyclase (ATP)/RNA 3'-terminal phosphate cyclase (GTP)
MRTIDGSQGEGGGSILRIATALALINQEEITIENIRKKRSTPGLRPQHLLGLRALTELSGGELIGGHVGSEKITFSPGNDWKSELKIRIPTAGSIGLVLQTLQIGLLAKSNHKVSIAFEGGASFGKWAPSLPYINNVTWAIFRKMGYLLDLKILKHGFFPKGGASVKTTIESPPQLKGINLRQEQPIRNAKVNSIASYHLKNARVAERQGEEITHRLEKHSIKTDLSVSYIQAVNPGSGVVIFSSTGNTVIAGDAVGERRKPAEKVGQTAYDLYFKTFKTQSSVDSYLSDQIIPVMALAHSSSSFTTPEVTNHTKTNINLIEQFTDTTISIDKQVDRWMISIDL